MNASKILSKIAIVGGLFLCNQAHAVTDGKGYAGTTCFKVSGGGTMSLTWGHIFNSSSTGDLTVWCPLVMDSGAGVNTATVKVFDRHPTLNVTCELLAIATSPSSGLVSTDVSDIVSTSGFGSGNQTITLTSPPGPGMDYYYLECTIPRSSGGNVSHLASIDLVEN